VILPRAVQDTFSYLTGSGFGDYSFCSALAIRSLSSSISGVLLSWAYPLKTSPIPDDPAGMSLMPAHPVFPESAKKVNHVDQRH
jgi:hypothetical protein